ncbi:MAG: hypothetical protein HYU37_05540 [Acidobacteria bacterium]|nr:hypothetical protein [Acidobacteriota bacterium]
MTRRMVVLALILTLGVCSTPTWAHDEFRIIGTLMKHESSTIEVKTRQGKTIAVRMDKQTAITRDKKKVDASELKAGQSLVVDAYGDTEDDALALEIRIVPPIRAGSR